MASNYRSDLTSEKQVPDTDERDPLTVKGYTKIFESCENISNVYEKLRSQYTNFDMNFFIVLLQSKDYVELGKCIFDYCDATINKEKSMTMTSDDYKRVIETLTLLENMFRNALLRPYIPAYRTINMNCGRYRCYINSAAEGLFDALGFRQLNNNLLIYTETNMLKTAICALTCTCFWYMFSWKLEEHLKWQNQAGQRMGTK